METMFATKNKLTKGKKCCQVFVSDKGYIVVGPMKHQDEFENALHCFFKEVGARVDLIVDGFSRQKNPSSAIKFVPESKH